MAWTTSEIEFLKEHYPTKGRAWCADKLSKSEASIGNKVWRLGIKARGTSEAWIAKNEAHAKLLTGRKRPDQAIVMLALHADGRLKKSDEQRKAVGGRIKAWIKENGHPKGSLGIQHTEETKKKIADKSRALAAMKTDAQWLERTLKSARTKEANGTQPPQRIGASWKAAWRDIGGVRKFYRSRWEANYARYLAWLRDGGHIQSWAHEPKTFWFDGIKRGCVSYLPDFCVVEKSGAEAYHEVKGWMDDRSITKIKRMAKYHPEVTLIVIDAKAYKELARKVSSLVPGWEI